MPELILVVDDEETIRFLLQKQLQEIGLTCETAVNGAQAVEQSTDSKYVLVLMDVQMPIMDGLEATIRIRKNEEQNGSHATIIALTANPDQDQCFAAGMDDFLFKPVDLTALGDMMRKWSVLV